MEQQEIQQPVQEIQQPPQEIQQPVQQIQQPTVQEIQPQQITAKEKPKEKDPKRVAAGKRLALISKKAKEEKMRKLLEQEEISWKQYAILSIGIAALGFAAYKYLFPQQKLEPHEKKVHLEMSPPKTEIPSSPEKKKKLVRGKPISMFD